MIFSDMAWNTCSMANRSQTSARSRWVLIACALAILCGLTTHVIADTTGEYAAVVPGIVGATTGASGDAMPPAGDLLAESALPAALNLLPPDASVFRLGACRLAWRSWFYPPRLRPPILSS